ncbi:DoxX family protein [Roseococcus sp. YIM B11640]|uniref:DoxX family protein n=1 Tax=Roseococcus sp. YIM B11640 TaxID=3133973 RepID=UPI003C7C0F82
MSLDAWAPRVLSVLRFVSGLIFLLHGTQKLIGIPARSTPAPELLSLLGLGGLMEIVGGALIMIGLFTRPVAFLLAGEMAVAYFMFHAPRNIFPTLNGGDAAILYCFIFFYFVFAGPGPWSMDAKRRG